MPEHTALGSEPSRLPGRRRAGTARTGQDAGPEGSQAAKARSGRASPGFKALAAAQTGRHAPSASHAPVGQATPPLWGGCAAPLHSRAPRRPRSPPGPPTLAPQVLRGGRHRGFAREPPAPAARPLRPCRRRCRRACYVQFSNQLELSMPSVSSWAAGEPAPPCARALRCGLARARAPTPRLIGVRGLFRGCAAPCEISAGPGALSAPGRAPGFRNVPASVCVLHPHCAGDTGAGGPATPRALAHSSPFQCGCWRGFPGPLLRRSGRQALAVGRRVRIVPVPRRLPDLGQAPTKRGCEGHLLPRAVMPLSELMLLSRWERYLHRPAFVVLWARPDPRAVAKDRLRLWLKCLLGVHLENQLNAWKAT